MKDFIGNPLEQEYENDDSMDGFDGGIVIDAGRILFPPDDEEEAEIYDSDSVLSFGDDNEENDPNFEIDTDLDDDADEEEDLNEDGDDTPSYALPFSDIEMDYTDDELEYVTFAKLEEAENASTNNPDGESATSSGDTAPSNQ